MTRRAADSSRKRGPRCIVFEGIDGVGKSTQAGLLAARLRRAGRSCLRSSEPGGTPGAEALRALLLHPPRGGWTDRGQTLLFLAARHEHVRRKLRPALKNGRDLVLDRFTHSTLAYQFYGAGLGSAVRTRWRPILDEAADGLVPDLVIVLDLSASQALARVRGRTIGGGAVRTVFETRGVARLERVRRGFLSLARENAKERAQAGVGGRGGGSRFLVLDASASPQEISEQVWRHVAPLVGVPLKRGARPGGGG